MYYYRWVEGCFKTLFSPLGYHLTQALTDPSQLPLCMSMTFIYRRAFRLPDNTFGASSLNYSEGPLEYNSANHSIYIVGHVIIMRSPAAVHCTWSLARTDYTLCEPSATF